MPDTKRTCSECGAFLEGYTLNNVTGKTKRRQQKQARRRNK